MRIDKLVNDGTDIVVLAGSTDIKAVRVVIDAAVKMRDAARKRIEEKPVHCPENLNNDVVFLLGYVNALNEIIRLPEEAKKSLNHLPEGEM